MQKADPQQKNTQDQPASRQGRGLPMESPQSEQIAQLEAMMDTSPAVTAQRKFVDGIHNSPHVVAQRKKLQSLFGDAAQLQGVDEEMLQGEFDPAQRVEEDEMLQGKFAPEPSAQRKESPLKNT